MLYAMQRQILHVDMDEFFAAVEKLDNPALRGKCLLVGGDPTGRGVVSTASYEARPFGCHSAMPMSTAVRLCPQAIVLPVRGDRYAEVSRQVFEVFDRYTPLVEPLSIDEAFLDVSGCLRLFGDAERIARAIKQDIRREIGLTASVGVAPNKFLAKVASDLRKPDGLVVITAENLRATLDSLPIRKLWGVGPTGEKLLHAAGITTFGQLLSAHPTKLAEAFGEMADHYRRLAEGLDDRPVVPDSQAKSISQECTFAVDVGDTEQLRGVLLEQVEQVARRLRRGGLKGRTVTLKLRTGDFKTVTRSATLAEPTDLTEELRVKSEELLAAWWSRHHRALRLLGMGVHGLAPGGQLALFDQPARQKQQHLDRTLDDITKRFGHGAVRRAGGGDK